jgi:lipopolysaccharide transport system ATP-binding protein
MKPAICVRNLSKVYHVTAATNRYRTLRDTIAETVAAQARRLRRLGSSWKQPRAENNGSTSFWALKDVGFDIPPGKVVGIVGRNGAGKSTLLKILSRITEPTAGRVELRGRVASLLEVGTGFHPELTGRENIFLNGAILGMSRQEITRKFDEIVDFAEIDLFLDTPVKRYSSGMYVRLAFAVAAHLEPEILLVDEVLAVGDAAFQKKCLGKMGEVARQGRTIIFVSHNIAAVESLCQTGILLERGRMIGAGPIDAVLQQYMQSVQPAALGLDAAERGVDGFSFRAIELLRDGAEPTDTVQVGDALTLRVTMELARPQKGMYLGAALFDTLGRRLVSFHSMEAGLTLDDELCGEVRMEVEIPQLLLLPGLYHVQLIAVGAQEIWEQGHILQEVPSAATLHVLPRDFSGHGHCFSAAHHGASVMPFRMRANGNGKHWQADVLTGRE